MLHHSSSSSLSASPVTQKKQPVPQQLQQLPSSQRGRRPEQQAQQPRLVFHESARSIVFRDQVIREATGFADCEADLPLATKPTIVPLAPKQLGSADTFAPLLASSPATQSLTEQEQKVHQLLCDQHCVIKTIKNNDWTSFLARFQHPHFSSTRRHDAHADRPAEPPQFPYNAFFTSTTLLPSEGYKMRCFGSTSQYTVGAVFSLPEVYANADAEDAAAERTWTWSWPAGYAAKTEFNIDGRGQLINGRQEALVPFSVLRQYNHEYLHKTEYIVAQRTVSGLQQIPYNEVYIRVGGTAGEGTTPRSLDRGLGLPVALFVRTAKYGHLMSLLRTRARWGHLFPGVSMPLVFIDPEVGCRIFTEELQNELWKCAANQLNPFANPSIKYTPGPASFQQKMEELFEFDESIRNHLTTHELAALAGGFGASDESVVALLQKVLLEQKVSGLQEVVHEGLAAAVRAGDYHTSRQLLLLYSLVAASDTTTTSNAPRDTVTLSTPRTLPPPPLDTSRLRSATNSDGLLAVLGAAQVLKVMQDGSAKRRVQEVVDATNEWVSCGEHSMAFRISSWYDQRAAQDELNIATATDSRFMAFVSNKAIANRKLFAQQLCGAVSRTDFTTVRFLFTLHDMLSRMHAPCLRLELLQYMLGLDNRYSVAHVMRSVELATSCLEMAASTTTTKELTETAAEKECGMIDVVVANSRIG